MFAEEQPALGPLPLEPFRYYRYGERTVHLDGCVEVDAAYYGAPPGWIGHRVQVQWNDLHVRLLAPKTGRLLREHLRAPRGFHRIHDADRPLRTPPSTVALLARARGWRATSAVCTDIHQQAVPRGSDAFSGSSRSPKHTPGRGRRRRHGRARRSASDLSLCGSNRRTPPRCFSDLTRSISSANSPLSIVLSIVKQETRNEC
jgi:hypothetical protein